MDNYIKNCGKLFYVTKILQNLIKFIKIKVDIKQKQGKALKNVHFKKSVKNT